MSGIAGAMVFDKNIKNSMDLSKLINYLSNQGNNDDVSVFSTDEITFASSKSISKESACYCKLRNLSVVYHGDLHNASLLSSMLRIPCSASIGEILLQAFELWGHKIVNYIEGSLVFAIWNCDKRELFIYRDPLGLNSIYYFLDKKEFYFCSSLPALVKSLDKSISIDRVSLFYYFTLQAVIPPPHTPFSEYKKLPPSSYAYVRLSQNNTIIEYVEKKYTYITKAFVTENLPEKVLIEIIREELIRATERFLLTTDSTCVWLSGGLDSSLIVAICAQELGIKTTTLSLGFSSGKNICGNEFDYSRYVSSKYCTNHKEITISDKILVKHATCCLQSGNEPMMSHDFIGHFLLGHYTKEISNSALVGLGADEYWYGYSWHRELINSSWSYEKSFKYVFVERPISELKHIINNDLIYPNYPQLDLSSTNYANVFEHIVADDLTLIAVEDPIKRNEAAARAHGITTYSPFLCRNMIDLSTSIPDQDKLHNGITKYLLKRVGEKYYPDSFLYRKKGHFPVPSIMFTSDELKKYCLEILNSASCKKRQIFTTNLLSYIDSREALSPTRLGGNILWQLTAFECWLQQFD